MNPFKKGTYSVYIAPVHKKLLKLISLDYGKKDVIFNDGSYLQLSEKLDIKDLLETEFSEIK